MKELIGIELKRNITRIGLLILIFFILSILFINYSGIQKIERYEKTKTEFTENEIQKVGSYYNYSQYGWGGFKLLFLPSPIASIFNTNTSSKILQSSFDTSFKFDINSPQKGEYVVHRSIDLTLYLIIIGSSLALIMGWFAFRCREFIKTLLNFGSRFFVYFSILVARTILIFLSLFLLTACIFAQFYIMGVNLAGLEIAIIKITLITFVVMIFFLFSGAALGTIKSASKSGVITFVFGLVLLFLWPHFFYLTFSGKTDNNMMSTYGIETEKLKILSEFEKKRKDYVKDKGDKVKATKDFTEKFLNDGAVEKLEIELIEETEKNINKFHLWSIINPVTFFESAVNEISSYGFNEQLRFYRYSLNKKREFTNYYLDKLFQRQTGKVEPFLSGDEYIFYAKPSVPHYFKSGLLVQLFYILALFTIGFYRFNQLMFPREKNEVFSNIDLKLKKGKHYVYNYEPDELDFQNQIFNVLMGKTEKFTGKITVDGENIVTGKKKNFVYLPFPDTLPGYKTVNAIIDMLTGIYDVPKSEKEKLKKEFKEKIKKRFDKIKRIEKVNLMFRMAAHKKADIYLLHNFLIYIKSNEIPGIIEKIRKENALFIELDSIHVKYQEFQSLNLIQLDKNSKYEVEKVTGE